MAGRYNLTCEQGADFFKAIRLSNSSGPIDLSNYSARMQVRTRINYEDAVIELEEGSGITLDSEGRITFTISAEDTTAISRDGVYDIELIDPAGLVHRLLQGRFLLNKEVTRDDG